MSATEIHPREKQEVRTPRGMSRTSRVLVPFFIILYLAQCAWFIRTQSFTNDEPEHLVAGVEAWRYGEFQHWDDQPPLAKLLFSTPLVNTDWKYQLVDEEVNPITPAAEVWLYRSRPVNAMLGVALLLVLWFTARRLFSEAAATFALALAVLSPDLIAHFSLATIDGAGTLLIFASVAQLVYWLENPTRKRTFWLGILMGLMLLSKFNSPPLFLMALGMMLALTPVGIQWRPRMWRWKPAVVVVLLACLVVWAGYFFHVSKIVFANEMVTIHFQGLTKILQEEMPTLKTPITIFLPACEWMTGFGMVVYHNMEGHRAFFLGQYSQHGWKAYFPVAVLLKWPIIVLSLGVVGLYGVIRRRVAVSHVDVEQQDANVGRPMDSRRKLLLMSTFPAVYFAFALISHINIGVRHVLPVYPFLLLYVAAVWEWMRKWKWAKISLIALVCMQALDIARFTPDYLSYFNIFVQPTRSWELLSDSNNDWGQGMFALRKFQAEHPNQEIHLAVFNIMDPAWYGIRYTKLNEADHPTGLVVVSATQLSGELLQDHHAYRWLLQYPVKTVLNHTLYVFEVPADTSR